MVSPPCEGARREQIRGAEVHSISSTSASQASTSEEESLATTLHYTDEGRTLLYTALAPRRLFVWWPLCVEDLYFDADTLPKLFYRDHLVA